MRRALFFFLLIACGANQKTEHTPPVASASPSATTSATASSSTVAAIADAGPKDWMWELVGGAREAYWRWPNGTCEKWRVEPDGAPADYRGTIFRDEGSAEMQMTYEGGDPPRVRAPRVIQEKANDAGTARFDLACDANQTGAWYLDEASCQAGAAAPLAPTGCLSAVAPETRAAASRALAGALREDLAAVITRARFVWTVRGDLCTKRVVRKRGAQLFLNDTYIYPSLVRWTMHGLVLEEQAEANPDHVPPRGGGEVIAIGCCSIDKYVVWSFGGGVAHLGNIGRDSTRPETWYVDRAPPPEACKKKP